jgi:anthranilate synthase component 2
MHGKQSAIALDPDCPIFRGLPLRIRGARYHSLATEASTLPPELIVTATTDDGEVMAVSHREYPMYGLQFHPESVLTPHGFQILANFIGGDLL